MLKAWMTERFFRTEERHTFWVWKSVLSPRRGKYIHSWTSHIYWDSRTLKIEENHESQQRENRLHSKPWWPCQARCHPNPCLHTSSSPGILSHLLQWRNPLGALCSLAEMFQLHLVHFTPPGPGRPGRSPSLVLTPPLPSPHHYHHHSLPDTTTPLSSLASAPCGLNLFPHINNKPSELWKHLCGLPLHLLPKWVWCWLHKMCWTNTFEHFFSWSFGAKCKLNLHAESSPFLQVL